LGILVPIPEDERKIQTALVKAALMKSSVKDTSKQGMLDFGDDTDDTDIETISNQWQDAMDKALANRTIFAQRRLKPAEVIPEWEKQTTALGEDKDVEEFVKNALHLLQSPLEEIKGHSGASWRFIPGYLTDAVKNRRENEGFIKPLRISFHYPPDKNAIFIHRSHPIVSILADHILENALEEKKAVGETIIAGRCGVFESPSVTQVTTIFLIRLRHQLEIIRNRRTKNIVAEEAMLLGSEGRFAVKPLNKETIAKLLAEHPGANLDRTVIERELTKSLEWFTGNKAWFEEIAKERADALLADHRRVRDAAEDTGQYAVTPSLPVDLIGIYVLLPASL
jgi:hypothetical protein